MLVRKNSHQPQYHSSAKTAGTPHQAADFIAAQKRPNIFFPILRAIHDEAIYRPSGVMWTLAQR
jgi:hypothetical protein